MAPVLDPPAGPVRLRVVPGPHDDWFTPAALELLERTPWTVTTESDRVGMRLAGAELPRAKNAELPSAGVVRGALQVAPAGQPTLFMSDHPLTGGYPVIAVVVDADVDRAAQVRPGQGLQFTTVLNRPRGAS
jgi:allophanate hydrolase subunit 2